MVALLTIAAQAQQWPVPTPTPTGEGGKDAAVIVAIGNYSYVEDVAGAVETGQEWYRWFRTGRGIPAYRVKTAYDASASALAIAALAEEGAKLVEPGGTLWFVFVGHGAPSADGKDGLLVGVDARQNAKELVAASVSRSALLGKLEAGKQANTVVLLDACFSGQTTSGTPIVSGLQPMIPEYALGTAKDTTRVLTAAGSGEFTGGFRGRRGRRSATSRSAV